MRYIIRKFVDADTVQEAIEKEPRIPIHDAYLKEGEEPAERATGCSAIGFYAPDEDWRPDEIIGYGKKR